MGENSGVPAYRRRFLGVTAAPKRCRGHPFGFFRGFAATGEGTLDELRYFVAEQAEAAGLSQPRTYDLVLAVKKVRSQFGVALPELNPTIQSVTPAGLNGDSLALGSLNSGGFNLAAS